VDTTAKSFVRSAYWLELGVFALLVLLLVLVVAVAADGLA